MDDRRPKSLRFGTVRHYGILSGKERKIDDKDTLLLQTDAATNPGSFEGMLLNLQGEVIGVSKGGTGLVVDLKVLDLRFLSTLPHLLLKNSENMEASVEHI